jgi:hypothetical protein
MALTFPQSYNEYNQMEWESQFYMNELSELEHRIKGKIQRIKHRMHKTQERTVTDRLWPEIETLNWVLNEMLILSRSLDDAN